MDIKKILKEVDGLTIDDIHSRLVQMSKAWNGKSYLVGGAVRDELMGVEPKDMDYVITKVDLETLADSLEKTFRDAGARITEIENAVGIVKVVIDGEDYEFAVPRIDVDRKNVETVPDLPVEEDLKRRDFTFNAIAKDLETGELVEPEGQDGKSDIKNGIIRTVGVPIDRFREDPLRMLRALQFASRFGFDIEKETWNAIIENKDLFRELSNERFKQEFIKAWTKGNKDTNKFFELFSESGVGTLLFGEDFNPIAIDTKDLNTEEAFHCQSIAAFLKGGDYNPLSNKTEDKDHIEVARWFYSAINDGINYSDVKKIKKHSDKFPMILLAFKKISEELSDSLEEIISKPLIERVTKDTWNIWELPVLGGELIEASNGKLQGKHIGDASLLLIQAYQEDKIPVHSNEEKSKEECLKYFTENVLKDFNLNEMNRISILEERMKKILYK